MHDDPRRDQSPEEHALPRSVEVFHAGCHLALYQFASLRTLLELLGHRPSVLVLGLEGLAALDARDVRMLQLLVGRCRDTGIALVIGGADAQARAMLARAGLLDEIGPRRVFARMREALTYAQMYARR